MPDLICLVLAAGHGTRMKSDLPKVLHPACGRPLVYYPVHAALELGAASVVVVVNPTTHEPIQEYLGRQVSPEKLQFAVQEVPRGTGDAARAGMSAVATDQDFRVLILSGDVPLLTARDLQPLLEALDAGADLSLMTFRADDPTGYGRVLRGDAGEPLEIREHRDLDTPEQRSVTEVNAGVYAARASALRVALSGLAPNNAQGEYYLTDVVAALSKSGAKIVTCRSRPEVLAGVNDRAQLREVEEVLFERIRVRHGQAGVSIVGKPLIDDTVSITASARIEDGVRLRGKTEIGADTLVDVGSVIQDTTLGRGVWVKPYCVLSESEVGDGVQLGPFAHLRPQSRLESDVHIGNFVETKNTLVRAGAKANHLSYLGDAEVGEKSNIGAGTIICNYDGYRKQKTIIGSGVFIGSDSQLVAPVTIGDGAYVATNTTVTDDVPDRALAIGRSRQVNKPHYAATLRQRLSEAAERAKKKE